MEVEKRNSRKIAAIVVLIVVVGASLAVTWWFLQQPYFGYTRIKVVKGNTVTQEFDGTTYYFAYDLPYFFNMPRSLKVSVGSSLGGEYFSEPSKGSRYQSLGLDIIVSEANAEYVVLLIKSL